MPAWQFEKSWCLFAIELANGSGLPYAPKLPRMFQQKGCDLPDELSGFVDLKVSLLLRCIVPLHLLSDSIH